MMCRGVHLIRDRECWLHNEGIIFVKMESAKACSCILVGWRVEKRIKRETQQRRSSQKNHLGYCKSRGKTKIPYTLVENLQSILSWTQELSAKNEVRAKWWNIQKGRSKRKLKTSKVLSWTQLKCNRFTQKLKKCVVVEGDSGDHT